MATIPINIPDPVLNRVLDAIALRFGYTVADGTKAAFAKKQVIAWVMEQIREQEANTAAATARNAASADVQVSIVLT